MNAPFSTTRGIITNVKCLLSYTCHGKINFLAQEILEKSVVDKESKMIIIMTMTCGMRYPSL